jgi:TP901 family phage tail tape measure protein
MAAASAQVEGIQARFANAGRSIQNAGRGLQLMGGEISANISRPIADVGAKSLQMFADFETGIVKATSLVSGITHGEFVAMREEALRLGATTVFTAAQSAEAMSIFARAGKRPNEIIQAMGPTMNLATAEQISLAEAAKVTGDVMAGLQVPADKLAHAIDVVGMASISSRTSAVDLANGIRYAGPSARSLGISLEDLTASLEVLAEAGISGNQAGRGLRTIFSRMAKPTAQAQGWFDKMGVSLFDVSGEFVGVEESINRLNAGLDTLNPQEQIQAGTAMAGVHQLGTFLNLVRLGGKQFGTFRGQLKEVGGTVDTIAGRQLDTLRGAMLLLISAVEGAAIEIGGHLSPVIRQVALRIQDWIAWWREVPSGIKRTILVVAAILAALGPVIVIIGTFTLVLGYLVSALVGGVGAAIGVVAGFARIVLFVINPLGLLLSTFSLVLGAFKAVALFIIIAPWMYAVAGIVMIIRKWKEITAAVQTVWNAVVEVVEGAFLIISLIVVNFGEIFDAVVASIVGVWSQIDKAMDPIIQQLTNVAGKAWELFQIFAASALVSFFASAMLVVKALALAFDILVGVVKTVVGWLGSLIGLFEQNTYVSTEAEYSAKTFAQTLREVAQTIGFVAGAALTGYATYRILALGIGLVATTLEVLKVKQIATNAAWAAWKGIVAATDTVVGVYKISLKAILAIMALMGIGQTAFNTSLVISKATLASWNLVLAGGTVATTSWTFSTALATFGTWLLNTALAAATWAAVAIGSAITTSGLSARFWAAMAWIGQTATWAWNAAVTGAKLVVLGFGVALVSSLLTMRFFTFTTVLAQAMTWVWTGALYAFITVVTSFTAAVTTGRLAIKLMLVAQAVARGFTALWTLGMTALGVVFSFATLETIAHGVAVGIWHIGAMVAQGVTWLWVTAMTALMGIMSAAKIMAVVTTIGLLVAAVAPIVIVVWAAWRAVKSLFTALAGMGSSAAGPLGAVKDMFGEWGTMLGLVVRAAKTDMPLAWEILKVSGQIALEQIRMLFPPLWEFVKTGFSAAWEFMVETFELNLKIMLAKANVIKGIFASDQDRADAEKATKEAVESAERTLRMRLKGAGDKFGREFKPEESDKLKEHRAELEKLKGKLEEAEEKQKKLNEEAEKHGKDAKGAGTVEDQMAKIKAEMDKLLGGEEDREDAAGKTTEQYKKQVEELKAVANWTAEALNRLDKYRDVLDNLGEAKEPAIAAATGEKAAGPVEKVGDQMVEWFKADKAQKQVAGGIEGIFGQVGGIQDVIDLPGKLQGLKKDGLFPQLGGQIARDMANEMGKLAEKGGVGADLFRGIQQKILGMEEWEDIIGFAQGGVQRVAQGKQVGGPKLGELLDLLPQGAAEWAVPKLGEMRQAQEMAGMLRAQVGPGGLVPGQKGQMEFIRATLDPLIAGGGPMAGLAEKVKGAIEAGAMWDEVIGVAEQRAAALKGEINFLPEGPPLKPGERPEDKMVNLLTQIANGIGMMVKNPGVKVEGAGLGG